MSEMDKLEDYLKEHNYDYKRHDEAINGIGFVSLFPQIIVYNKNGTRSWDAICFKGSYGYEEGLLEIYGSIVDPSKDGDTVVGYLTAQDIIKRLENIEVE